MPPQAAEPTHTAVGEGDGRKVRYSPDHLPVGIHLAGRGVVVYVVTDPWLDDFRLFLERHAAPTGFWSGSDWLVSNCAR